MKKLTALLLAGAMLTSFTACGPEENKGYIAGTVTNMGEFDFDQTVREVKLNSVPVELPCKVSELGSGFSAVNGQEYDECTMFDLEYNGKKVGFVRMDCDMNSAKSRKFDYIEFHPECDLQINGLSFKSTIENVEQRFGTPDSKDKFSLRYCGKGEQYVEFCMPGPSSNKIDYIAINF